jgi:hypothetical protein
MNEYINKIYNEDIYKNLELLPNTIEKCNITKEDTELIFGEYHSSEVTIIEVGSFLGSSACHIAKYFLEKNIKPLIFCVDTWLGDSFMRGEKQWMNWLRCKNGYSTLYYQFLSNMIHNGIQEYIIPIPYTSFDAFRYLNKLGVLADFCYLDASHHFEEITIELENYMKLVKNGGTLFGDDYDVGWPEVMSAFQQYVQRNKTIDFKTTQSKFIIKKI